MDKAWLDYCKSFIPQIKARHKQMLGRECNLENPQRLTDKLEWLKVYDSTFLKTYCSDKLTARKYVAAKLGKDISIPVLGVYDKFDDIDFSKLPKDYVIKTNHGSHTNIIVRHGKIDKVKAKKQFDGYVTYFQTTLNLCHRAPFLFRLLIIIDDGIFLLKKDIL